MIHYKETYEIVTPESAEDGEAADAGYISENESYNFRDMVELLRGTEPSCWPLPAPESCGRIWYTTEGDTDYRTGEVERRCYHPIREYDGRYMAKAWRAGNKA